MKPLLFLLALFALFFAALYLQAHATGMPEGRITERSGAGIPQAGIAVFGTPGSGATTPNRTFLIAGLCYGTCALRIPFTATVPAHKNAVRTPAKPQGSSLHSDINATALSVFGAFERKVSVSPPGLKVRG